MKRRGGRVAAFTATLIIAGLAAALVALTVAGPARTPWAQALPLVGVLALASHLIIRVQVRDQAEAFDLFEAVLAPTLFVFTGPVAVVIAAAAKGIAGAIHRNEPAKALFNVGQWTAAAGSGSLVFALLRSGTHLSAHNLGALSAAMVAVALVNYASFTTVVALAGRRSIRSVISEFQSSMLVGWFGASAVNVAFGLLFVSAYVRSPFAIVLMVVPLAVLHWGGRGFATARTDTIRLTGLQAATHVLAGPIDPRDALPRFLAEVRACFESDAVELVETAGVELLRHRVTGDDEYSCEPDDGWSTAARLLTATQATGTIVVEAKNDVYGLLTADGWRVAAAAPVRAGERSFGVLCVYNRGGAEGFQGGEVVVLEALAAEVAGALAKAELLEGMLEERRQLADIVGNTSDGILTLDEHGACTSWNNALEQITGYALAGVLGRLPDEMLCPRDAEGHAISWSAWHGAQEPFAEAVEISTADHQSRWLSCAYTEIPPREGRGPQLVVIARDVTRARELEKLQDDFVAVVSHELRTPLAPIKGWAVTLLKRGDELPPEQRREGARAILRQADRLEQLILNILEDSKIELDVNALPVDEVVDAAATVRKVVDDFALLAPERVVTMYGAEDPAPVTGRTVRIEQILVNLVANAVKYSPKHEPIEVFVERGVGTISISVTDHGPGIPPEARERVFDRFERLAETPTQTGTGLGLYIARRLASSMDAYLDVTEATGGGSTFTLRLKGTARTRLQAVG